MSQLAATAVGPETQELRFATVMTGGVSLAIWMGGVTRELNLLQRASNRRTTLTELPVVVPTEPDRNVETIYLRLLNLLDMTADVDILAGTSAGGINAAVLGLARVNGIDLAPMRDIWLQLGGFEGLLRDPKDDNAPSLLQGDGVLLTGLNSGMTKLWKRREPVCGRRPTTVHLTTTLIAGETSRFTDAYGTLVQDVTHHGSFTFNDQQLSEPCVCAALATAARSSASFPLAFEPGFVGLEDDAGRPGMRAYANITRAQWVADGGLLANRPIQPLLRDIFERPADRQVRRVLLYVIPSPGAHPDPRATPEPARLDKPLSADEALLGDLGAVIEQSISGDLRAFREHNDRVDSQCDTRLRLAQLGLRIDARPPGDGPDGNAIEGLRIVDAGMLEDYRARQSDWLVRPVVAALMCDITSRPETTLPRNWLASLAPGRAIEEACRAAAAAELAAAWTVPSTPGASWYRTLASFGPAAIEGAKGTVIAMLRSAFALTRDPVQREAIGQTLKKVHSARPPGTPPDVVGLVREALDSMLERGQALADLDAVAATLARIYWQRINPGDDLLAAAWAKIGHAVHAARDETLVDLARAPRLPAADHRAAARAREPMADIRRDRPSRDRAATELATYVAFLSGDPEQIAVGLFDLHVATRSVLPVAVEVEQPVEFVQISADSRTLLSERRTAGEKLTGRQLQDFGAFYKSSWRANDWTWGRVDGAGWLVHILLDPRRIDMVTLEENDRAKAFYERLREALALPGGADGASTSDDVPASAILEELDFLDAPGTTAPKSLPKTALWVAREVQRWIACAELPVIAKEIIANGTRRVDPWAVRVLTLAGPVDAAQAASLVQSWEPNGRNGKHPNRALARLFESLVSGARAAPPQAASTDPLAHVRMGELLASCEVPDEKLERELGEPLFTRTVTKAAAVAGSLAAAANPIRVLGPAFTTLRTITMGGYRAVNVTGGLTAPLLLTGLAVLVIGIVLAIYNTSVLGIAGAGLAAIGLYVIAITSLGYSRRALVACASGLGLVGLLAIGAGRQTLFGTARCSAKACSPHDVGWFGSHVLPWLANSFWHVMLAIVVFFGLAALIGIATTRRSRARPRTTRVDLPGHTRMIMESAATPALPGPRRRARSAGSSRRSRTRRPRAPWSRRGSP